MDTFRRLDQGTDLLDDGSDRSKSRRKWEELKEVLSFITRSCQVRVQRDPSQEPQSFILSQLLSSSCRGLEDLGRSLALGADKATHVLDDAKDGDVDLAH